MNKNNILSLVFFISFLLLALFSKATAYSEEKQNQKVIKQSYYKDKKSPTLFKLFNKAEASYQAGNLDDSFKDYERILTIDHNNTEARLGMELIDQKKKTIETMEAKNTRWNMINKANEAWSLPFLKNNNTARTEHIPHSIQCNNAILNKINEIIIPEVDFFEIPVSEALRQIKIKASLLDVLENDPNKKGVNIVLQLNSLNTNKEPKITLSLTDIPLKEVLNYIAKQANLILRIEPYAAVLVSQQDFQEQLVTKEYKIPSTIIPLFSSPHQTQTNITNSPSSQEIEEFFPKEFFTSKGVIFPKGSIACYLLSSNTLIVKNTQPNLDLIDSIIASSFEKKLGQIEIEARFLEVTQNNLNESGFDWLLGSFQLPYGSGIANNIKFPTQINSKQIPVVGALSTPSHSSAGSTSITASALDTTTLGALSSPATEAITLTGILTNPQFQVVLRALNQHGGLNLLSAPKVTVASGEKALINIARQFPYPTDYTPPQIPQNQGNGVNPAIPATPSSFKKRDVGVQLEVTPTMRSDNSTIELNLSPQIVEFQGFVNYGTPVYSQAPVFLAGQTNTMLSTEQVLLTQNTINQPVFSIRQVTTDVILHDGQTIVLGGLMRDDMRKTNKKIPLLGNIPFLGSLFQSSSNQKIKQNLLIFVTVHVMNDIY